jgi:H+/Cl- antiporter ClcA
MSAARVIPFPQTARSHAKQMETRSMALLLGGLLALLIAVAVGVCLGRRWPASDLAAEIASVTGKHS